jgi:hypothetical protein
MNKEFDCLKMKEDIYAKIYSETKQMNLKEYVEYITESVKKSQLWQKFEKTKKIEAND